jgi:hypothetical protein
LIIFQGNILFTRNRQRELRGILPHIRHRHSKPP